MTTDTSTPTNPSETTDLFEHADHELRVTENAVYIGNKMYALSHLTAVNLASDEPNRFWPLLGSVIISGIFSLWWLSNASAVPPAPVDYLCVSTVSMLVIAGHYLRTRPTYDLILSFLGGDTVIFRSSQQETIEAAYRELEQALLNQR